MPRKGFAKSGEPGESRKSREGLSHGKRGLHRGGSTGTSGRTPASPIDSEVRTAVPASLPVEAPVEESIPPAPAEPSTPVNGTAAHAPQPSPGRQPSLRKSSRQDRKTARRKRSTPPAGKRVSHEPPPSLPGEPPLPTPPPETPAEPDTPAEPPPSKPAREPSLKRKRDTGKHRKKSGRSRNIVVRTTTPQGSTRPDDAPALPPDHPLTEAKEALKELKRAIARKSDEDARTGETDAGEWDDEFEEETPGAEPAPPAPAKAPARAPARAPAKAPARAPAKAPAPPVAALNQFRTPEPKLKRIKKSRPPAKKTAHAGPRAEGFARLVRPTALFLFLMGWWFAVLFAHGFDLHRLYWPSLFAGTGAVLLALTNRGRLSDFPWTGFAFLVAGCLYFLIRAWTSPVYDLGRLDIPLVCGFGLAVVVGATKPDWRFVAPTLAAVAMGHVAVGFYQEFVDSSFAVFRGERADQHGVSGLYYHRNYLAGFLEIFLPFWGTMLVGRRGVKPWAVIINAIVLALAGFLLVLTASRGGLASAGIGFLVAMFIVGAARWRTGGRKTRTTLVAVGSTFVIVFIIALVFLVQIVFEQRGKGGDFGESISAEGRLGMAGMAYEQWLQSPVIGSGSRSYSYESITNWDSSRLPGWLGTPNMAHDDYLQVLTDYGLVGLILILGFAAWLAFLAIRRVFSSRIDRRRPGESWIPAAVLGALVASVVHGVVDFSLHILPNLMMLGLVIGLLPGLMARKNHTVDLEGGSRFKGPILAGLAALLAVSWVLNGWRELAALPAFLRLEQEVYAEKSTDETRRVVFREVFLRAPSYPVARDYGALELDRATEADSSDLDEEIGTAEAIAALEVAAQRHPYDGLVKLNYANALELAERTEEAGQAFQKAIALLWRREDKYGAMLDFALHLARRGIVHDDAGEEAPALAYFEMSKTYLEESWRLNHRPDSYKVHKKDVDWLAERIQLMRDKGIKPQPLDGIDPPPSLPGL